MLGSTVGSLESIMKVIILLIREESIVFLMVRVIKSSTSWCQWYNDTSFAIRFLTCHQARGSSCWACERGVILALAYGTYKTVILIWINQSIGVEAFYLSLNASLLVWSIKSEQIWVYLFLIDRFRSWVIILYKSTNCQQTIVVFKNKSTWIQNRTIVFVWKGCII